MKQSYSVARFTFSPSEASLKYEEELPLPNDLRHAGTDIFPVWISRELALGNLRFRENLRDINFEFILLSINVAAYRGVVIMERQGALNGETPEAGAIISAQIPFSPENGTRRVLVVDDNDNARMIVTGLLKKLGIEVDLAENGIEAVEKAYSSKYDLILMDLSMPKMSGLDATSEIRSRLPEPNRSVPILAMTASSYAETNEDIYSCGMNGYLAKPVRLRELMEAIEPYVSNSLPPDMAVVEDDLFEVNETIDLTYLKEVSRGDIKFASEVLQSFIETTPKLLADIRLALSVDDFKKCRDHCHKIKPTFSYVGLKRVIPLMEKFHSNLLKDEVKKRGELMILEKITELTNSAMGELRKIHSKMLMKLE